MSPRWFWVAGLFLFSLGACNSGSSEVSTDGDDSGGAGGSGGSQGSGATASGGSDGSGGAENLGGTAAMGGLGGQPGAGGMTTAAAGADCDDSPVEANFDNVFDVGPGEQYASPSDVPWESLAASTLVRIHARDEPYRDKWVINAAGTEAAPIIVTGVSNAGRLPVIEGEGATTRNELDYWNEDRSLIKIGGSNSPSNETPAYITVRCLDLRGAHIGFTFTDADGAEQQYAESAASVHIERGEHITVEACSLSGSGNGLFSSAESSDVLVRGNRLFENGNIDSIYHHNSYTESLGITFEYNHYGALCAGCPGNNLKDRSAGTVIRYNWIENGNRQLDLVETDYEEFFSDSRYRNTYVYGNLLIEAEGEGNRQIIHYGGDSGELSRYRKGTLHLFHNTIVSTREGRTTLVRLSSEEESLEAYNNIIFATSGGSNLELLAEQQGSARLTGNWVSEGWVTSFEASGSGSLEEAITLEGRDPGFVDGESGHFELSEQSDCVGAAVMTPSSEAETAALHPLNSQYSIHQGGEVRETTSDIGALAHRP